MGGGKKKKPTDTATAPVASTVPPVLMQNYPAFQPGQAGLLANQMSAGFGGSPISNAGLLSGLYHDVQMPVINRPDQIVAYLKKLGIKPATSTGITPPVAAKPATKIETPAKRDERQPVIGRR